MRASSSSRFGGGMDRVSSVDRHTGNNLRTLTSVSGTG